MLATIKFGSSGFCVLSIFQMTLPFVRHSGMPLAGIQSGVFLDSGQNRAGMTEG
jgi:hypothetical protein